MELTCQHCGDPVEGLSEDWRELARIPWCKRSFEKLWDWLPENFSREDYVQAHTKALPGEFRANDNLLVQLLLAPACVCNSCMR